MDQNSEKGADHLLAHVEDSSFVDTTRGASNQRKFFSQESENRFGPPQSSDKQPPPLGAHGEISGFNEDKVPAIGNANSGDQPELSARPKRTIKPTPKLIENRLRSDKE